jgi:hypothetical protein
MLEKEHKVFIFLGIPIWVCVGLLMAFSGYPGIMMDLFFGAFVFLALVYGHTHHRTVYWFKFGLVLLVMNAPSFLIVNNNPAVWGEQFQRNNNMVLLITPDDEHVVELDRRFQSWLATSPSINSSNYWENTKYSTYYDEGQIRHRIYSASYVKFENMTWSTLDDLERALIIDWYVRHIIITWTPDEEVYGIRDYKATPHEILQQNVDNGWIQPAKDDCDGEAVVTVSLMRRYGLNSYIGDGKAHWFTVVEFSPEIMQKYRLENVVMFNFWSTVYLWAYFNEKEYHIGQSPLFTMVDLLLMDNEEDIFGDFYTFAENYAWALYPLLAVVAIIAVLFVGFPRAYNNSDENENRQIRREKLKTRWPWAVNPKNPVGWLLVLFYVRTGNPFRRVYRNEWFNAIIAFVLFLIPIIVLLGVAGSLTQHALLWLNLYIFVAVVLFDRDVFVRIKDQILHKNKSLQ